MESSSHLRRPTSGIFADRSSSADKWSDRSTSSANSSPRSSITDSPTLPRSSFTRFASVTNSSLSGAQITNPRRISSTPATDATSSGPQPPSNRIASTLSKFEKNDAAARASSITGLKPVGKLSPPPSSGSYRTSKSTSINSSSLTSSNNAPGNRFLNGKSLNSVSSNKFSMGPTNRGSGGGSGGCFNPSSLLRGPGVRALNKGPNNNEMNEQNKDTNKRILKREEKEQLLRKLTPTQFRVTQEKITERPYSNKYYKHWDRGVYSCVVCGEQLFLSHTKYDSGSGWPAFYDIISWDRVSLKQDLSHVGANLLLLVCNPSLARTEVSCATCNSHIGHVFDDGPKPTGQRFCVNSASLSFSSSESKAREVNASSGVEEKQDTEKETESNKLGCGDTLAPLVHMASPGNSCSLGARLCFRVPTNIDGCDSPVSRT